jgi:hypothetical protein
VVDAIESGNGIAVELRITMTHTGTFATAMSDVPPTGSRVVVDSCDVVHVEATGKVASWQTYLDQAGFIAQLGVASPV